MTDSLSQYCPNCEAQANTIEELRAANERWVIAFKQAEERANGRIEALQADNVKLREALVGLTTDEDDDPCWFDHNGNCQAHFITNPCEMALARKALQETER